MRRVGFEPTCPEGQRLLRTPCIPRSITAANVSVYAEKRTEKCGSESGRGAHGTRQRDLVPLPPNQPPKLSHQLSRRYDDALRVVADSRQLPDFEPSSGGDQGAGGKIPRVQAAFVIRVVAATRDPGEVEGRSAHATDVAHAWQHAGDDLGLASSDPSVIAESGRNHRG